MTRPVLTLHSARWASRGACGHPIIQGDSVGTYHAGRRSRTLCHACTRKARMIEATALDHRLAAAAHARKAPAED